VGLSAIYKTHMLISTANTIMKLGERRAILVIKMFKIRTDTTDLFT